MSKKMFNMCYGLGGAVVIIGALFKINHWPGGDVIIAIGLIVEAIVFSISAFEPVEGYDWTKVYPELKDETNLKKGQKHKSTQTILSEKLDKMLNEAGLDVRLMEKLKKSIQKLEKTATNIDQTTGAVNASQKYEDQLLIASTHLESLNALYSLQLEKGRNFAGNIEAYSKNSGMAAQEFKQLNFNLSSLNSIYGGMLLAMNNKN